MKLVLIIISIFSFNFLSAQQYFPDTDRPSNSYTPHTINKNGLQTEMGFLRSVEWLGNKEKSVHLFIPQMLARYGASQRLELRAGVDLYQHKEVLNNNNYSYSLFPLVNVGVKYKLIKQRKIIPTLSIMSNLFYKTKFNNNHNLDTLFDYSFKLLFENIINDYFQLRYAAGYERILLYNPNKKFTFSITPTYTIDDSWRLYLEYHGFIRIKKYEQAAHYISSGLQYALNLKTKFDINCGYNLGRKKPYKSAQDFYYGIGISYKFN